MDSKSTARHGVHEELFPFSLTPTAQGCPDTGGHSLHLSLEMVHTQSGHSHLKTEYSPLAKK